MAMSIGALQSFAPHRITGAWEFLLLPGDPGVTFTRGNRCKLSNGVLVVATGSDAAPFVVQKTVVCPAAATAFPFPRKLNPFRVGESDASKCLVMVGVQIPAGTQVQLGKIANHFDDTVTSYTAATRALVVGTGMGADDRPNAALLYVYEGTGAGQLNVVEDYVHATLTLTMHRDFEVALDATSKVIVLAGEAAATRGIGLMGRCDLKDQDELDMSDGANDGTETVLAGWRDVEQYISLGHLPVIRSVAVWA